MVNCRSSVSSFCTSIPPELTVTTRGCSDLAAGEGIQYCNAGGGGILTDLASSGTRPVVSR